MLLTSSALSRVHELWPFLGESDPHAVMELVVARTADHLRTAITQAACAQPASPPSDGTAASPGTAALQEIQQQLATLSQEVASLKREVAQFSALRNNLITRLDEAVARAKDALAHGAPGAGIDPLVEARRDRDMGVMKSTLTEILESLQRIELNRSATT